MLVVALAACQPLQPPEAGAPPSSRPGHVAPVTVSDPAAAWPLLAAAPDVRGAPVGDDRRPTVVVVFASWCGHCRHELDELSWLMGQRDDFRVVGINFRHHEEYDDRGSAEAVDAFVRDHAPWLRVVPAGGELWTALGGPPKVPSVFLYAPDGRLAQSWDRRVRAAPDARELGAALDLVATGRR